MIYAKTRANRKRNKRRRINKNRKKYLPDYYKELYGYAA